VSLSNILYSIEIHSQGRISLLEPAIFSLFERNDAIMLRLGSDHRTIALNSLATRKIIINTKHAYP